MQSDRPYAFCVCAGQQSDGEIVFVDFEKMMESDVSGFVKLKDGREARRARSEESLTQNKRSKRQREQAKLVSEALGFDRNKLAEFEADRVSSGVRGVEFVEDVRDRDLFNVQFDGPASRNAYIKHRGFFDKGKSCGGSPLSERDIANAKEMVSRKFDSQS